jgi:hypothetical protein
VSGGGFINYFISDPSVKFQMARGGPEFFISIDLK